MAKLDKTQPYGVVYGSTEIQYEQGGVHFKHDGTELERWTTPEALENEKVLARERLIHEQKMKRRREALEKAREAKENA